MKTKVRYLLVLIGMTSSLISSLCDAAGIEIKNGQNLPQYILNELSSIGFDAGETSIAISSKERTVERQVQVMLDYYIYCTKGRLANRKNDCGIGLAKQVYHRDCHGGFDSFSATVSRDENVRNMTLALTKSLKKLGESRTCMNHVVIPGIKTRYVAVDIKPSSIDNHKKFYQAVTANPNVKRFYYPYIKGIPASPVKDSAFHIEFFRGFDKAN
ncbi:MAG: hypothetical protein OQJ89_14280 [Kangiellaceae bacterium]|nr:hypothetical protein [Kangiellaceae bacterium]MCW8998418.1 hypothetical protein [Kangiellaceae bacterium]MCW9018133.1 hypothetical protein [Kangiellaceae bacterium]